MKTFRQFNEEATLTQLRQAHVKSKEGRQEAQALSSQEQARLRRQNIQRAYAELSGKEEKADEFTREMSSQAASTKKQLKAKAAQQEQEAEQSRAAQRQQTQKREQDTAQLAARLKQAASGATRFVKSGARKLGRLMGRS